MIGRADLDDLKNTLNSIYMHCNRYDVTCSFFFHLYPGLEFQTLFGLILTLQFFIVILTAAVRQNILRPLIYFELFSKTYKAGENKTERERRGERGQVL